MINLAVIVASAATFANPGTPIENIVFHQHQLERWLGIDATESRAAHHADSGTESDHTAAFEDPEAIFRAILNVMPAEAIVYPSERYYYYEFDLGHRRVSGNIRFTDAEEGIVHIGYFDRDNQRALQHRTFTQKDGLVCRTVAEGEFEVEFNGTTRRVRLALDPLSMGRDTTRGDDEWVTGLLDESGWTLALLWNPAESGFFYAVAPEAPRPERLVPLPEAGDRLLIGRKSRMVFWKDEHDRLILVGVAARNIADNSWFDGPFDQVPPRLPLRDKIEAAYPYVKYRGGIDEHGNFLELDAQRVAISPYQSYRSIDELLLLIQGVIATDAEASVVSVLTYEQKRDLSRSLADDHDTLTMGGALGGAHRDHRTWVSQGWPANHHALASGLWPRDHRQADSSDRRPNSVPATWPRDRRPDTP